MSRSQSSHPASNKPGSAFWKAHVKAWHDSGLNSAEYCRRHNLSYHALTYWHDKFKDREYKSGSSTIVPVMAVQQLTCPSHSPVRIRFKQEFSIEIDQDFDEALLRKIIKVLEGV